MDNSSNDEPQNNRSAQVAPPTRPGRYYQQALLEQRRRDRSNSLQQLTSSRPLPPLPDQPLRYRSAPNSPPLETVQSAFPHLQIQNSAPDPTDPPTVEHVENMAGTSNNNNAFPPVDTSFNSRGPGSVTGSQVNGAGAGNVNNNANYMAPLPMGHQQDLNFLYAQIQELSGLLQINREKVSDLTRTAEEVARRAHGTAGTATDEPNIDAERARMRTLEHELARAKFTIDLYKHEQTENTKLIGMYEEALGTATEQIRNYCNDIDGRFLAQRRHYNNLLQAEKDEHLASRLDRDHWHAMTLRCAEMIRTAYRLRCEEENEEYGVVVGLQLEVRCMRRCLGLEDEKPEEETGWPILKDAPQVSTD